MKPWFLALILTIFAAGCHRVTAGKENQSAAAPGNPAGAEAPYFKTHFQDESQYLVEAIVTDIAEMAFFAKNHTVPSNIAVDAIERPGSNLDSPTYQISVTLPARTVRSELNVNRPIWSPELYADISGAIFESLDLRLQSPGAGLHSKTELLKSLLELTADNIERENENLSELLDHNFTDAELHERAALLLGAFALRERVGTFNDVRSPLCRMTAHLAVANALSKASPYGPNGQVAEALLYTLMDNEADGVAKAAALDHSQPELEAWSRVIYTRNTEDYRPLETTAQRSLAETFEYFQACAQCLNAEKAWEQLPDATKTNYADPCRILIGTEASIELGHVLLETSIPVELRELNLVYNLSQGHALRGENLVAILNQPPDRCFTSDSKRPNRVRVIGWGQWAMYFQRHLCDAIVDNVNFLQNRWGVPEEAAKYAGAMDKSLSGLVLYPFVRRFNCTNEATYRSAIDLCYPAAQATPHLFAPYVWNQICYPVRFTEFYQPFPNPHINEWFKHNPPPGTAYDPSARLNQPNVLDRPDAIALVERLHDRAPYHCTIVDILLRVKYQQRATFEQEEELYRPVLEYNAKVMSVLANKLTGDPPAYENMMVKSAQHSPVAYLILGNYFAERGNEEKAIRYLEQGMDFDRDGVRAAAYAGTLIKYYVKRGQTAKAAALADQAAEVYSFAGLKAKADFLETAGKYAEAEGYYERMEERYGSNSDMIFFLLRYKAKTGKADLDQAIAKRITILFPKGIERVSLSELKGPPNDGITVGADNTETAKAGLKKGAIIVALYGIRIHNFSQYNYAKESVASTQLDLIVWQDGRYQQIMARPPARLFGVQMPQYQRS